MYVRTVSLAEGPSSGTWSRLAPAGLTLTVIKGLEGNDSSTDSFCWEGDEDGLEFESNTTVSQYFPSRDSTSSPHI